MLSYQSPMPAGAGTPRYENEACARWKSPHLKVTRLVPPIPSGVRLFDRLRITNSME